MTAPVCLPVDVRPVPGFPSLRVAAGGEVYGPRGQRKLGRDSEGYLSLSVRVPGRITPAHLRVHVAVLTAWVGPAPAGMEGRHLDGDKANCALDNLCWSTHADNMADRLVHGTVPAKLTAADVREMRRLRPTTTLVQLAERFGVHATTASRAVLGRHWRHVR